MLGALVSFAVGEEPSPRLVVEQWVSLYGRDTAKAALLTTKRFREGEEPSAWVERANRALKHVGYEHRGGQVSKVEIRGKTATVYFNAKILTNVGITEQTEIYTLIREGEHWFIDALTIGDEEAPETKNAVS